MGSGTAANPYTSPTDKTSWQYNYLPSYQYLHPTGLRFYPTAEEITAGFVHYYGGHYYRTNSQLSGAALLESQIKVIEARIAQDTKDLTSMNEALKLLNDNPAYTMLLDLHKRGLL